MSCSHAVEGFVLKTGPYKGERVLVDGPEYETAAGSANVGIFDPDFVLEMNFYCDTYGIDTISGRGPEQEEDGRPGAFLWERGRGA
jgi:aldehyde:ferredoxin oxidoreductase